jgi:hypothetical protein
VIELWLEPSMSPHLACAELERYIRPAFQVDTDVVHVFHVTERVAITANARRNGTPNAVNLVALLSWLPPFPQAIARWEAHEKIALRVHRGASHYDRNIVLNSNYDGFPVVGGIVDFGFASLNDFVEHFWDSSAGATEVAQDVAGFVGRADRLFLTPPLVYER